MHVWDDLASGAKERSNAGSAVESPDVSGYTRDIAFYATAWRLSDYTCLHSSQDKGAEVSSGTMSETLRPIN